MKNRLNHYSIPGNKSNYSLKLKDNLRNLSSRILWNMNGTLNVVHWQAFLTKTHPSLDTIPS